MKKVNLFLILFFITLPCFAQPISAPLEITEEDASPSTYPYKLIFPNASVTDNGDGTTTVAFTTSGTLTASVLDVEYINNSVDGAVVFLDDIDINGYTVTGLRDPTAATDAVPKDYVDEVVAGASFDFFLNNTASGVGTYYTIDPTPTGDAESSFSDTITGDAFLIDSFITASGQPTFTTLNAGVYALHFHADTTVGANIKTAKIYYEFYEYDDDTTETLIATSEQSDVLNGTKTSYEIHCTHTETIIESDDRLLVKVYANIEDGDAPRVNDPVVTIYAEGNNATRFSVSTTLTAFDDRYVEVAGDTMSGNLAMGSNDVTGAGTMTGSVVDIATRLDIGTFANLKTDSSDNLLFYDVVTGFKTLAELSAGAAGGDSVSIDGGAVVDPDFVSTGDIDFVDTSNTITANINANKVQLDELDVSDVSDDIAGDIAEGELADSIVVSADIKDDTIDSDDYAADSIDNEHINWADIDNLGDEGVIPSGATVTDPNAAGELAIDTSSDQFLYYGGAQRVIPYFYERGFVLEDPVAGDDDVPFWHPHDDITITDCYCETQGGTSVEVIISDGTNALETVTCDADGQADDGSIANGTFSANERMEFDIGTVTGAVDWVAFTITYVIDPD